MSHVCGKNGSNLRRVESVYNVNVTIAQNEPGVLLVKGLSTRDIYAAEKEILVSLSITSRFNVDEATWEGSLVVEERRFGA